MNYNTLINKGKTNLIEGLLYASCGSEEFLLRFILKKTSVCKSKVNGRFECISELIIHLFDFQS